MSPDLLKCFAMFSELGDEEREIVASLLEQRRARRWQERLPGGQ